MFKELRREKSSCRGKSRRDIAGAQARWPLLVYSYQVPFLLLDLGFPSFHRIFHILDYAASLFPGPFAFLAIGFYVECSAVLRVSVDTHNDGSPLLPSNYTIQSPTASVTCHSPKTSANSHPKTPNECFVYLDTGQTNNAEPDNRTPYIHLLNQALVISSIPKGYH